MAKLTVRDLDVRGKRVFLRVDYNVPLEEKDGQMVITDDTRIVATLPTLKLLIEKGGKLILTAHLGRPKGKRDATMSLKPVAVKLFHSDEGRLESLIQRTVRIQPRDVRHFHAIDGVEKTANHNPPVGLNHDIHDPALP